MNSRENIKFQKALYKMNGLMISKFIRGHSKILYFYAHPKATFQLISDNPVESDWWFFIQFSKWELHERNSCVGNEYSSDVEIDEFIAQRKPTCIKDVAISDALTISFLFNNDLILKVFRQEFFEKHESVADRLETCDILSLMTLTGPNIEFEVKIARKSGKILIIEDEDLSQEKF